MFFKRAKRILLLCTQDFTLHLWNKHSAPSHSPMETGARPGDCSQTHGHPCISFGYTNGIAPTWEHQLEKSKNTRYAHTWAWQLWLLIWKANMAACLKYSDTSCMPSRPQCFLPGHSPEGHKTGVCTSEPNDLEKVLYESDLSLMCKMWANVLVLPIPSFSFYLKGGEGGRDTII